jgi:tryptophan-rich hypothetical protein
MLVYLLSLLAVQKITEGWVLHSQLWPKTSGPYPSTMHKAATRESTCLLMGLRGKKIRREKRKALREPTPARVDTPYGPIRFNRPPRSCECCRGRGVVRCTVCEGRGVIRQTGQRETNTIQASRLIGSKWTSVEIRNGHRQHTIVETRGSTRKETLECRIINICGNVKDSWISLNELKNKGLWRKGWTTLEEIQRADRGPLRDARFCFRCKGEQVLKCVDCDGKGNIPSYEPLYE